MGINNFSIREGSKRVIVSFRLVQVVKVDFVLKIENKLLLFSGIYLLIQNVGKIFLREFKIVGVFLVNVRVI